MAVTWLDIYREVADYVKEQDASILLYRGHSDAAWRLEPGLARDSAYEDDGVEPNSYFSFVTKAGRLLEDRDSGWSTIFTMQHHGLPTRLLDWSENFAVALYFAMKRPRSEAAIWVLNPFKLNRKTLGKEMVINPSDLDADYFQCYIRRTHRIPADVVAFSPLRHNQRVFNQKSGFTLHDRLDVPLEELHPDVVKKFVIPDECFDDAKLFLDFSGVSEFSLFPDLDGLAREIKDDFF